MKTIKNIMNNLNLTDVVIYIIGGAILSLILFTTICGVIKAATDSSLCFFGIL